MKTRLTATRPLIVFVRRPDLGLSGLGLELRVSGFKVSDLVIADFQDQVGSGRRRKNNPGRGCAVNVRSGAF